MVRPRLLEALPLFILGVGLVLFVALAVSGYRALAEVDAATRERAQARESLLTARTLLSNLKDVETGQRGYLLTGDAAYLEPFESGIAGTRASFARLDAILPEAVRGYFPRDEFRTLIERRIALAARNLSDRRWVGQDDLRIFRMLDEGRETMDALRVLFDELDGALRARIKERNERVQRLRQTALWQALALTGIGIGLVLTAFGLLLREQRRRARTEAALAESNTHLESTVAARTRELAQARDAIAGFARQLDAGIETERRRLAREVHDQIGQIFTALRMSLARASRWDSAEQQQHHVAHLIDEGIATTRRIAAELRPPLLDDLGLAAALRHHATGFAAQSGIACEVDIQDDRCLGAEQAIQLFRIAQEALTNVARHAAATRVLIGGYRARGHYRFEIVDDGIGIQHAREGAAGLVNMRERAQLAGGRLELVSAPGKGTRVVVTLPVGDD